MTTAAVVFALLGPVVAGWLIVKKFWPEVPAALRLGLGVAAGLALSGTSYFLALVFSDSPAIALISSEAALACAVAISFWKPSPGAPGRSDEPGSRLYVWFAAITAVLAGAAFVFALDSARHGEGDALVLWNLKARLIAASTDSPFSAIFDSAFSGLHPDYPLLLPSLVARGWQYAGTAADAVPIGFAGLFTLSTVVLLFAGLREVTSSSQSWVAGGVLLGTPFLLRHGASQYADIAECCFMTAAVLLYCIYDGADQKNSRLPVLAGFLAAAAACTKNEGILFLMALFTSRVAAGIVRRASAGIGRELLRFGGGAAIGLITIVVYKLFLAPPNDTVLLTTFQELFGHAVSGAGNREVARGMLVYLDFGEWAINPVPLMAAHIAVTWGSAASWRDRIAAWFVPAFVVLAMFGGIYAAYLLGPYNIEAHIQSSLNRLMLQLWPTLIILYSLIVAPRHRESATAPSKTALLLRLLVVLGIAAAFSLSPPATVRVIETSAKTPRIDVSRRVVTAGDTYFITITGVAAPDAYISYSIDGEPMGQFQVHLGERGNIDFHVSAGTRRGLYQFVAIRPLDSQSWIPFDNDASITVR